MRRRGGGMKRRVQKEEREWEGERNIAKKKKKGKQAKALLPSGGKSASCRLAPCPDL